MYKQLCLRLFNDDYDYKFTNVTALRPLHTVVLLPPSRLRSPFWAEKLPLEFDACFRFFCCNVAYISVLQLV